MDYTIELRYRGGERVIEHPANMDEYKARVNHYRLENTRRVPGDPKPIITGEWLGGQLIMLDPKTNAKVKLFEGITAAAEYVIDNNLNRGKTLDEVIVSISDVLRGRHKTCGKHAWVWDVPPFHPEWYYNFTRYFIGGKHLTDEQRDELQEIMSHSVAEDF